MSIVSETGENVGPTILFLSLKIRVSHIFGGLSSNYFCSAFSNYLLWSQAMKINLLLYYHKNGRIGLRKSLQHLVFLKIFLALFL